MCKSVVSAIAATNDQPHQEHLIPKLASAPATANEHTTSPNMVGVTLLSLAALGGVLVVRKVLGLLGAFYTFFLRSSKSIKEFGQWAVVTGATDGIGKALALELARKGANVALMSRAQQKLEEVRDEILAKYPTVKVEILAIDFTKIDDPSVRASIKAVIAKVQDVGVLINNVGITYDFPEVRTIVPGVHGRCWRRR